VSNQTLFHRFDRVFDLGPDRIGIEPWQQRKSLSPQGMLLEKQARDPVIRFPTVAQAMTRQAAWLT
jgi:hypothetical protein